MRRAWLLMLAERAIAGVAGLVSLGLLARHLDADSFGAWVLATTAWSVGESVRGGLVGGGFLRHHAAAAAEERGAWIAAAAALGALGSLAGGALGVAIVLLADDPGARALLWLTPGVLFATWALGTPSLVLQARGHFGALVVVRGVTAGAWLALLLPGHTVQGTAAVWIAAQLGGAVLAAAFAALPRTRVGIGERLRPARLGGPLRALAGHGGFGLVATVGSSLYRSADLSQIGHALGSAASGLYAQALRPVDLIEIPLQAASSVVAPRLAADAARSPAVAAERAARAGLAVSALAVAASVPVFVLAEEILVVLVGSADPLAVTALRILLLTNALRPFDRMVGLVLDAAGRPRLNAAKVWLGLALDVVVNVLALRFGGAHALAAVAAGSFFATAASIAVGEALTRRALGVGVLGSVPTVLHSLPALRALQPSRIS